MDQATATAPTVAPETLKPGERVVVHRWGWAGDSVEVVGGVVVAVDAVAVRVRSGGARGEVVVPWCRIERVVAG